MKKLLIYGLLLLGSYSHAQVNEVLRASQFGGVSNVSYNPAIADNRYALDINLISVGVGIENNYIGLRSDAITHPSLLKTTKNLQSDLLKERIDGGKKGLYVGMQVQGPLSFLYSWGKERKNAIAFSYHVNAIANVDGVNEKLARMAYYGMGWQADSVTAFNFQTLDNHNIGAKALAWSDFGLTYSRVLYDDGTNMFKAGVTGKVLLGMAAAYVYSDYVTYRFRGYDTLDIYNTAMHYGHSGIFSQSGPITMQSVTQQFSNLSVGGDIGFVYEWRSNHDDFPATQSNTKDWYRHDVNTYKIAVGASIVDLGCLTFARPVNVHDYNINIEGWLAKKDGIKSVATFDQVIATKDGRFIPSGDQTFQMWLPTRLNAYVDYEIWKGIGVNLATTISPVLATNRNQVHYPSFVSITPRYDHKWIGAYLPISFTEYGNLRVGAGLRLGPLFVTSSDIISVFASHYTWHANVQAGVKISIPNLPHYGRGGKDRECTDNFSHKMH